MQIASKNSSPALLLPLLAQRGEGEAFAWLAYFAVQDHTASGRRPSSSPRQTGRGLR
jgi:hypothetical protein